MVWQWQMAHYTMFVFYLKRSKISNLLFQLRRAKQGGSQQFSILILTSGSFWSCGLLFIASSCSPFQLIIINMRTWRKWTLVNFVVAVAFFFVKFCFKSYFYFVYYSLYHRHHQQLSFTVITWWHGGQISKIMGFSSKTRKISTSCLNCTWAMYCTSPEPELINNDMCSTLNFWNCSSYLPSHQHRKRRIRSGVEETFGSAGMSW